MVLEVYFRIDTILKPYRVLALLLAGVFFLKQLKGIRISKEIKTDIFLYLIIVYGIGISLFQMIINPFSMGRFFNDLFQAVLYLVVFFIFKNSAFSLKELINIFKFLFVGIIINCFYVLYNFYFLGDYSRQSGFMDNPNYLSLSIIIALVFLAINPKIDQKGNAPIFYFMIPVLAIAFIIAGSRTGIILMLVLGIMLFFFASLRSKLLLILGGVLLTTILGLQQISSPNVSFNGPLVLVNRINSTDLEDEPRFPLWKGVMKASQESYFMGLGIGQFKARFPEYYRNEANYVIYRMVIFGYHLSPHSDYFAILVSYGIIGLLLYLTFLYLSFRKNLSNIQATISTERKRFFQFQLLILVSLLLFGLVAENFNSAIFWFLLSYSTKAV